MIRIERGEPPKGNRLDERREKELQKIRKAVKSGKSYRFETLWSDRKVKKFLHRSQHGKCCYCERKRDEKRDSDVEHFRPKARVEGAGNHLGYWWLAYNWENLLIACKTCNEEYKKSKFPLKDESKRAYTEKSDIDKEEPIMINPLKEDPELLINYDFLAEADFSGKPMVKAVGKCMRSKKTVDGLTGINDENVMLERADKLEYYETLVIAELALRELERADKLKYIDKRVRDCVSSRSEFSGFARFYFRKKGFI